METFLRNKIIGDSKVGLRHKLINEMNQDAFQIAEASNGVQIIAVCDGCSSAEYARLASNIASLQAVNFAKSYPMLQDVVFDKEKATGFVNALLESIRNRIADLQESFNNPGAFASTLLFAIFVEGRYLTVQLGDGAIVVSKKSKMKLLPTKIPKADRPNVTYSTCDLFLRKSFDAIVTVTTGEADHLFLMTDGIRVLYTPVVDNPTFHALAMANTFYSPENRLDMVSKLTEICSSATMDDATLVCASNTVSLSKLNLEDRFRLCGFDATSRNKQRKKKLRKMVRFYEALTEKKTANELAKKLNISSSQVYRIANRLQSVGLIEKNGDSYRRTNRS